MKSKGIKLKFFFGLAFFVVIGLFIFESKKLFSAKETEKNSTILLDLSVDEIVEFHIIKKAQSYKMKKTGLVWMSESPIKDYVDPTKIDLQLSNWKFQKSQKIFEWKSEDNKPEDFSSEYYKFESPLGVYKMRHKDGTEMSIKVSQARSFDNQTYVLLENSSTKDTQIWVSEGTWLSDLSKTYESFRMMKLVVPTLGGSDHLIKYDFESFKYKQKFQFIKSQKRKGEDSEVQELERWYANIDHSYEYSPDRIKNKIYDLLELEVQDFLSKEEFVKLNIPRTSQFKLYYSKKNKSTVKGINVQLVDTELGYLIYDFYEKSKEYFIKPSNRDFYLKIAPENFKPFIDLNKLDFESLSGPFNGLVVGHFTEVEIKTKTGAFIYEQEDQNLKEKEETVYRSLESKSSGWIAKKLPEGALFDAKRWKSWIETFLSFEADYLIDERLDLSNPDELIFEGHFKSKSGARFKIAKEQDVYLKNEKKRLHPFYIEGFSGYLEPEKVKKFMEPFQLLHKDETHDL